MASRVCADFCVATLVLAACASSAVAASDNTVPILRCPNFAILKTNSDQPAAVQNYCAIFGQGEDCVRCLNRLVGVCASYSATCVNANNGQTNSQCTDKLNNLIDALNACLGVGVGL